MLRRAPRPLAAAPLAAGGAVSDVVVFPSVTWLWVVVFVAVVIVFVVFVVAGLVLVWATAAAGTERWPLGAWPPRPAAGA